MNAEKFRSTRKSADARPRGGSARWKWMVIYNLGFFLLFLGLFNPLLWVSVHAGAERSIIFLNVIYTALLAAVGGTVMLTGRRRLARDKRR